MRTIIRCPSCFTYVYSDARQCHGCGETIGKRRWLTRGSWVFITLAVAGYAIARGIDLHQDKRDRERREFETALEIESSRKFLHEWLTLSPDELTVALGQRAGFATDLLKLRGRFQSVLPASRVESVSVTPAGWVGHQQSGRGPISHEGDDRTPGLRASWPAHASATAIGFDGNRNRRYWTAHAYEFEAAIVHGGNTYSVSGEVCVDDPDATVHCLTIRRVEGVEGVVKPTE